MLVQKMRLQRGWSQGQLAELSGLSVRTVQRIERGQTGSDESLKSLAAVFEVDFQSLKEPNVDTERNQGISTQEALALNHVRKLKGFYFHASIYVVVVLLLSAVNYVRSPDKIWVIWVILGWGIGLAFQALRVFDRFTPWGPAWERREVEKYLGRKL